MAEGAMERVVDILKAEFDRSFKLINSKTYPVSGGELNPANVDSEIEAFAQLGVSRGLDSKEAHYLANLYGSNAPKVFALAHSLEQAPGLSLADTLSLHYAMRNELALSPVDFLLRRTNTCSLCVIVWIALWSQFWMKWDDSMIGQKKKKQPTVRMLKQPLLTTI